uniref:Uncharacterized protein n=1 Tax=Panagrellus redivivus TaxID=6233 RepID=A0A7E4VIS9_PANRE
MLLAHVSTTCSLGTGCHFGAQSCRLLWIPLKQFQCLINTPTDPQVRHQQSSPVYFMPTSTSSIDVNFPCRDFLLKCRRFIEDDQLRQLASHSSKPSLSPAHPSITPKPIQTCALHLYSTPPGLPYHRYRQAGVFVPAGYARSASGRALRHSANQALFRLHNPP